MSRETLAAFLGAHSVPTFVHRPGIVRAQILRFLVAGGISASVDYGLLYFLTALVGVHYWISSAIGFLVGSALNYTLSRRFVYRPGRYSQRVEGVMFFVITAAGLVLNQGVMWVGTGVLGVNYMATKGGALVIVTSWNFYSKKYLVFLT